MSPSLLLALACAFGYTFASLFLKSSLERRATAGQVNCYANLIMALVVQPLWWLDRPDIPNAPLWQPLVCCATFFIGQLCTFAALEGGDVSIVTPILGTKVVIVTALNAFLFHAHVPLRWWLAALVASISVTMIAGGMPRARSREVLHPLLFALAASACYSLTDVLVQHWGGLSDEKAFLPAMFGAVGLLSVIYYLVIDRRAFRPPPAARKALVIGSVILGIQCGGMFLALVWSQDATGANIMYASRCVWSVVAAWTGGHLLGLRDWQVGRQFMARRLLGASLLFGAILLIVI